MMNMKYSLLLSFLAISVVLGCKLDSSTSVNKGSTSNETNLKKVEAVTLLGDTLYSYSKQSELLLDNYYLAKDEYERDPSNADAIIWYGRRVAYMGRYREAIDIFAEAIEKHPDDARMYRHRGHRYISIREYDKAIEDLEKACELIRDQKNEIEADGIPNEKGIPISTLHGNIYYHLALAYYLKDDLNNALRVYDLSMATEENDDNIVSTGHWKYMTLRRLGYHDEAERMMKSVKGGMEIIENVTYYEMCLFYKGILKEEWFDKKLSGNANNEVFLYGLANWQLYERKDSIKAKSYIDKLLSTGSKASFAFLAAEADYKRLFSE